MGTLIDLIKAITDAPLANLFVAVGLFLIVLAYIGRFGEKVELPKSSRKSAILAGFLLLLIGTTLYLLPYLKETHTENVAVAVAPPEKMTQSRKVIEAASNNLLLNPSAEKGLEHWSSVGEVSVSACGWRDKCFVVRNGGHLFQDVEIDRAVGGYALFLGKVSSERINRNGSITGLPCLYGYMMLSGQNEFIVDYLQGQKMLGRPTKENEWVYAWGLFYLPYSVNKIRFFANQALRKGDPHNGSRSMFNGLGLYLFPTEDGAKTFLQEAGIVTEK